MLDHNFVAAPFADGHVATASISASLVVAIKITTFTADPVSIAAVGSNADVQLGKPDFRFGRTAINSVFSGCRKRLQRARDGSGKQ